MSKLIGKMYGDLEVLRLEKDIRIPYPRRLFLCKCHKCGKEVIKSNSNLRQLKDCGKHRWDARGMSLYEISKKAKISYNYACFLRKKFTAEEIISKKYKKLRSTKNMEKKNGKWFEDLSVYTLDELQEMSHEILNKIDSIYRKKEAAIELTRVIRLAKSYEEFVSMWRGNEKMQYYMEDELLGYWDEYMDGFAGDKDERE